MVTNSTKSLLVWIVLSAICTVVVLSVPTKDQETLEEKKNSKTEVDSLFDCQHYRQVFGKKYDSHDEEMARCVYLLSAALDVFTSGVAYKFRKQNYYLAVNQFSDSSPRELDMMRNKAQNGAFKAEKQHEQDEPEEQGVDLAKVVDQLRTEIGKVLDETRLKESLHEEGRRKKREVPQQTDVKQQHLEPRHLSMDMLVRSGNEASNSDGTQQKVVMKPASNNKYYDALKAEPMTQGLVDEQEVNFTPWVYRPVDLVVENVREHLGSLMAALNPLKNWLRPQTTSTVESDKLPNEMFADLRQTGCFLPPRNQGYCGSCYAFASVAILEYMYCKRQGSLTPFSEQYMIDCGRSLVYGLQGCAGGHYLGVSEFIHNYGMELRHNYRYVMHDGECPYDKETPIKTTGYIRYEKPKLLHVPIRYWPELLDSGYPLYVRYKTPKNLLSYAGGVHDGLDCSDVGHAMVLVGHGREDGQEFWLLRNSYGPAWGVGGYFKLAKSVRDSCFRLRSAIAFGTNDGKHFAEAKKNELNKDAIYYEDVWRRIRNS